MSTALVTMQRYNWMGYNGTETEEVNTALLRIEATAKNDYHDYARRQQVIADIKRRLYLIKRDLDLIPEDELRAERERHERRLAEQERQRAEEESARAAAAEAQRLREAEERAAEEEAAAEAAAREAAAQAARDDVEARLGADADSDADSEALNDDEVRLLEGVERTPQETRDALTTFAAASRIILVKRGAMYTSYLDGSIHPTLAQLDAHNRNYLDTHDTSPNDENSINSHIHYHHEAHSTAELHTALDAYTQARQRLDAHRARHDAAYATRLRAHESAAALSHADGAADADEDESTLVSHALAARAALDEARRAYNTRAHDAFEARVDAMRADAAAAAATTATAPPADAGDDVASSIARAHMHAGPI